MTQQADLAVFIGRFQPFHLGHLHAAISGLKMAKHVLIVVGDTGGPRGLKNPWTFEERREMIRASLTPEQNKRVCIDVAYDMPSDTDWIAQVSTLANEVAEEGGLDKRKIILIGHEKDKSSFYIRCFPQWNFHDTGFDDAGGILKKFNATDIRKLVWSDQLHYAQGILHPACLTWLVDHIDDNLSLYDELTAEYDNIRNYRASWSRSPFPPVFITTDCVVVQSGHILLVQRGERPGKGLWALPGGFIDQAESITDCALRELDEETNIKLQKDVLRRCIVDVFVEDRAGGVSDEDRGRIVTHVHVIKLDDSKPLPKVQGGDDAAVAKWVLIGDIDYRQVFSDHGKIIQNALGRL